MRHFALADPYGGEAAGPVYGLLKGSRLRAMQICSHLLRSRMSENSGAHQLGVDVAILRPTFRDRIASLAFERNADQKPIGGRPSKMALASA